MSKNVGLPVLPHDPNHGFVSSTSRIERILARTDENGWSPIVFCVFFTAVRNLVQVVAQVETWHTVSTGRTIHPTL